MANFRYGAAALGLTFAAIIAAPAFASVSAAVCSAEGGDTIKVQGGDFCLVPIRPAEYAGPEYDGNQLGIVDCPGDKISDGAYCMAPITGGAPKVVPEASPAQFTPSLGEAAGSVLGDSTPSVGDVAGSVLSGSTPSVGGVAGSVLGGSSTPSVGSVAGSVLGGSSTPSVGGVAGSVLGGSSTPSVGDVAGSVFGGSSKPSVGSLATSAVLGGGVPSTGDIADVAMDAAKDAATDAIQDQAKKQVTGALGGLGK